MEIRVRADQPVKVTGKGFDDRVLAAGQTETFNGEDLSVAPASLDEIQTPEPTDDVFAPTNRPNGAVTAGIAPKMPKSGGETRLEPVGANAQREVAVAEVGRATQAGGPDAEIDGGAFRTPGPQPRALDASPAPQRGAATGDTDARGAPRSREKVSETRTAAKKGGSRKSR